MSPSPQWKRLQDRYRRYGAASEAGTTIAVFVLVVWGTVKYIGKSSWDPGGLLSVVHNNWIGALLIGAVLFHRTIQDLLDRLIVAGTFKFSPKVRAEPTGEPLIEDVPPEG